MQTCSQNTLTVLPNLYENGMSNQLFSVVERGRHEGFQILSPFVPDSVFAFLLPAHVNHSHCFQAQTFFFGTFLQTEVQICDKEENLAWNSFWEQQGC